MDLLWKIAGSAAGVAAIGSGVAQNGPNFGPPTILPAVFMVGPDVDACDINGDGVVDIVQSNPGFAIGSNFVAFRAKLLERDGSQLADATGATPAGPPSLAATARIAVGDFDEDGFADIASVTLSAAIGICRNSGQSTTIPGFGASVLVDDLTRFFTIPWPTVLHVPLCETADYDGDGHLDLLIAPVLADHVAQSVTGTGLFVYFGRGDGTFEPVLRVPTGSAAVDADWIDWDRDGRAETLLVLGQNSPNSASYTADVARYRFAGRIAQSLGAAQPVNAALFATSIAHVTGSPLLGGHHAYFVTGHSFPSNWTMRPELCVLDVDPQGTVTTASMVALPYSISTCTFGDLQAAQAADFDLDGHTDLVALVAKKAAGPGELVWLMGPLDSLGSHASAHVHSLNLCADTRNAPPAAVLGGLTTWRPHLSAPRSLMLCDLELDQVPDLFVGCLMTVTQQATTLASASLRNLAQFAAGPARGHVRDIAPGRAAPSGLRSRCGTRGGMPHLGNPDFVLTLGDAPRDALVGAIGGTMPASLTWLGLQFAFVPDVYGNLQSVHAAAEGAGRAEAVLPVPSDLGLLGLTAFFQWTIFDANAIDPFPIYTSNAIEVEFGLRL